MTKPKYQFGFDIGSISINAVVVDGDGKIHLDEYHYCHGKPFEKLREILETLEKSYWAGPM
jgi:predicted NBD/HSP70 family sugar kinase